MEQAEIWMNQGIEFAVEYGPKILGAILIYIFGSWVIKNLLKGVRKMMAKGTYDLSLQRFLVNMLAWALKALLVIIVISTLGVNVTTFAAIIGAAGLAVGLALQGSLSNFAGGVLIMIFKPYKIDDLIDPRMNTVSSILKHVHKGTIETAYSILNGEYEVIEAEIINTSELINKELKNSNLPEEIRIGAILRGEDIIIPRSNFVFQKEDVVVFLAKKDHLAVVENMFRISSI